MDKEDGVIDVRVVATNPNRVEEIKSAAIATVVTVVVTTATTIVMELLTERMKAKKAKAQINEIAAKLEAKKPKS